MDWSQEKCPLMIEAYQNYRCLWDPTFEHYKNTTLKQDAWQEIANLLECNVEEAKKKMDSLLASYRRGRQKTMTTKSGSGADCTYNSKWFAFKSMHFLMDKYKPRKTFDFDTNQNKNMADRQETERNEQEGAEVEGLNGGTQSDPQPGDPQPAASVGSSNTTTQSQPSTSLASSHTTIPPKKLKPADPRVDEAYRILKDTYESKIKDKCQAFGNHVASKHREYSKRTKAYVEHYINNILFDADLGKFEFERSLVSTPMSSYSDSSQNILLTSVIRGQPPPTQRTTVLEDSSQNILLTSVITDQPPPNQRTTVLEDSSKNTINIPDDNTETEETRGALVYYFNSFK